MFTLLLAAFLQAQGTTAPATTGDAAIFSAQDARLAAMVRGDAAFLETATDASLTYHHSSGNAQSKDEFLKAIREGALKYKTLEVAERKVRRFGSAVVVTGVIRLQAVNNGEVVDSRARFTDIYELKNGKYVQVAWQSTRLTPPAVPTPSPTLH